MVRHNFQKDPKQDGGWGKSDMTRNRGSATHNTYVLGDDVWKHLISGCNLECTYINFLICDISSVDHVHICFELIHIGVGVPLSFMD